MLLRVKLPLESPNFEEAKSRLKALGFSLKRVEGFKKELKFWELELLLEQVEATRQKLLALKLYPETHGPRKVCEHCSRLIRYAGDGSERVCSCFKY